MLKSVFGVKGSERNKTNNKSSITVVSKFVDAWNSRRIQSAVDCFSEDCEYNDTAYYKPFVGKGQLKRHLLRKADSLPTSQTKSIDDISIDSEGSKICIVYHMADREEVIPNSRGCAFFTMDKDGKIATVLNVPEPNEPKPGDEGLKILKAASKVMASAGLGYAENSGLVMNDDYEEAKTSVERYFYAWNRRDMTSAIQCFANDCLYDDAQYPKSFEGKESLRIHLDRVADCLPRSFVFIVDDLCISSDNLIGVRWHVENGNGEALPFTRGCSLYSLNKDGLIQRGFDVPEPAVLKPEALRLGIHSIQRKIQEEPIRIVPLSLWALYMYIVFFSDGILPGANALALEQRTWEEVRDLSINFFLVSPLLQLPFSPSVHPCLEGIFNLLLAWAAMFAGFLSDDREDKPNLFPMVPAVAGMQFLTSAFFLPYLGLRSSEKLNEGGVVYKNQLGEVEGLVGEWKGLGSLLGGVGSMSIAWSLYGRPEYGTFGERYSSLIDLLSIDRVGSSFVVDLLIFGSFQWWLVDDDMRRRGVDIKGGELSFLRGIAKYVPFFGLAAYLTFRPNLPSESEPQ